MTALDPAARESIKLIGQALDSKTLAGGRTIADSLVEKHAHLDSETLAHVMADALIIVQQMGEDGVRTLSSVVYDLVSRGGEGR